MQNTEALYGIRRTMRSERVAYPWLACVTRHTLKVWVVGSKVKCNIEVRDGVDDG